MTPNPLPLAERFVSIQGEGVYTGVPMAFLRLVGCSVGKKICTHCDTDFDRPYVNRGGGVHEILDLVSWVRSHKVTTACITGGEPFDRNLEDLFEAFKLADIRTHVETSGTKRMRGIAYPDWITVSPKPGYDKNWVFDYANEVKVILGGLGDGPGWPGIEEALEWAEHGIPVFLQPRNDVQEINEKNMAEAYRAVLAHPLLRLSTQMHKFIHVR